MTAEIAILNKSAVALAADSAVTIGGEGSRKIFNTVNKLFTLSKHRPVGIMVYGSAQIMDVPWETIIKIYRQRIGTRGFARLEDYAQDFLRFLGNNRSLFPTSEQSNYFRGMVGALYRSINDNINKKVKDALNSTPKNPDAVIRQIIGSEIDEIYERLKKEKTLPGFSEQFASRLKRKFRTAIRDAQNQAFQKLPLRSSDRLKLKALAGWLFTRDCFRNFRSAVTSGVVVAGFGEKDIYPRLNEFIVEGVIENRLRYRSQRDVHIGSKISEPSASIVPFAQSQVVQSFMEGIDPSLERVLFQFLDKVFADYPNIVLNHIPNITASNKAKAAKKMKAANKNILGKFRDTFGQFRQDTLVNPIVSTVGTP